MEESFESYQGSMATEGMEWIGSWAEAQEASPEAIARIEKNQKKAKAIAQQIKKSQSDNRHLAAFLVMIIQNIEDEKLISSLHQVFFLEDTGGSQHNINDKLITGLFAPFFQNVLEELQVHTYFQHLIERESERSIDGYTTYLKKLSSAYHNDVALNQQKLTQLIIYILTYFGIIEPAPEPEYKQQIITRLLHDLFGIQNYVDIAALDF